MWIDAQHGTQHSARYLVPGGLWETFTANKNEAWDLERNRERFWQLMVYCRRHFM
jgi:hypothetical protein